MDNDEPVSPLAGPRINGEEKLNGRGSEEYFTAPTGLQDGEDEEDQGNFQWRLVNPFRGKSHDEMVHLTRDFINKSDIEKEWHEYIRKGAFLAQDPNAFRQERDDGLYLERNEAEALRQEHTNRWDQPFILYALVICCSLGAAVQGWDETAVNQAQIFYADDLGIPHNGPIKYANGTTVLTPWRNSSSIVYPDGTNATLNSTQLDYINSNGPPALPNLILGFLNAAPYLCCAVAGCWLTDPLNKLLGRRGTIFVSCIIACLTCLGQAFANSWATMFVARFCLGFGMGPKSATVPIYAAETAPKYIRGSLVMMWQMWTAFGIMLGYIAGVVFQDVQGSLKWRLIIGSPCVLPVVVCAYVFTLPESPRWLLAKARAKPENVRYYRKAFASLRRLRRTPLQAARDLISINYMLEGEEEIKSNHNRISEMFLVRRNRTALQAGVIVMFFQQFCGVNIYAYYSTLIFRRAGYSEKNAEVVSLGCGIINFLFAFPAFRIIDSWGRRNLLLFTFPFMVLFNLFTGLAFQAPQGTMSRKVLVTVGTYLFMVAYSPGEGPVPFTYSSECMALYVRDLGMSLFTAVTWFFNFLLAFTFPSFLDAFKDTGAFAYYAAWCVVGFVLILLFVPETGGQSLEELDARFDVPSSEHARHGMEQFRYFFMHYVLRRRARAPKLKMEFRTPEAQISGRPLGPRKRPVEGKAEKERLAVVTGWERD